MIELFIENKPADIDKGFSTLLTFAIDDVKDFGAKNTAFSKTIVLPGTKSNNALFGNIFEIKRSTQYSSLQPNFGYNYNAAVSAKALIFSDNIQVFKGVLRLMEIIIDNGVIEYEVAVFGELGGLIYNLGNKKLEELDFSAYNMAYTAANIVGSWDDTIGSGVYFPLIDYGTYSVAKHDWSYRTFRPALFVAEYLQKIFAASSYTYNCPLFATARFKNLIIPHNGKGLMKTSNVDLLVHATPYNFSIDGSTSSTLLFSDLTTLGNFAQVTTGGYPSLQYGAAPALNGTLDFDIDFNFTTSTPNDYGTIALQKNGVTIGTSTAVFGYGGPTNLVLHYSIDNLAIVTGDVLRVLFLYTAPNTASEYIDITVNSATLKYGGPSASLVPINLGELVPVNDSIPKNILQKDFFSSIVKLFNLYVYEDLNTAKLLNITPFPDFYNLNTDAAIDWTNKLDRSKPIKIKPLSELNARYYEFKYKSDSDFYNEAYKKRYNEGYGDMIFDSQFEFAQEKQAVEIIFSGTPLVGYPAQDKIYSTIFKSSATTEECIDSNIRILQKKKIEDVIDWAIKDGAITLSSQKFYGYAGHLDDPDAPTNDLNFGVPKELLFNLATGALNVNQFNVYYASYMAEITDLDSKLLTAKVRLTRKDINELNFSRFIWLDGSLFRLNKVVDYNATDEDTCTVELLKVINTQY